MSIRGKTNKPLYFKGNGQLIKSKIRCYHCHEYGKSKNGLYHSMYAVYTFGENHLCKACAKKEHII